MTVVVPLLALQMVLGAIEEKEEVQEPFLISCKSRKAFSACLHICPSLQNFFTKSLVNRWLMHKVSSHMPKSPATHSDFGRSNNEGTDRPRSSAA